MTEVIERLCANPVTDGILNKDVYFDETDTPVRVLFLLKEANDRNGGGWDLRDFLQNKNGGRGQTWNNVTRWVLALGAVGEKVDDIMHVDVSRRKQVLPHIAVVNMKKMPGGSVSNTNEIQDAAKQNANLLRNQISECKADVNICFGSGVADGLDEVFADEDLCWKEYLGHRYGHCGNAVVLDYWHPAARKSKSEMVKEIAELNRVARQETCS